MALLEGTGVMAVAGSMYLWRLRARTGRTTARWRCRIGRARIERDNDWIDPGGGPSYRNPSQESSAVNS